MLFLTFPSTLATGFVSFVTFFTQLFKCFVTFEFTPFCWVRFFDGEAYKIVIGFVKVFPPEVTVCVVTTRENDATVDVWVVFVLGLDTTLAVNVFGFVVVTVLTDDVVVPEVEFTVNDFVVFVSLELLQFVVVWFDVLLFEIT